MVINVNEMDIFSIFGRRSDSPKNSVENADIPTRNVYDPQSEVLLGSTMGTSQLAESEIRDQFCG